MSSNHVNIEMLIPVARKLLLDAFNLPDSTPQEVLYSYMKEHLRDGAARAIISPVERRGISNLPTKDYAASRKIKGAERIYSDIVAAYRPFVKRVVQQRFGRISKRLPWLTFEDLCQEALTEFYLALMQFDIARKPAKKYYVLTYCTFKIRSRVNALINHERKTPPIHDTSIFVVAHEDGPDSELDIINNVPDSTPDQLESMVTKFRRQQLDEFISCSDKYNDVQKQKLFMLLEGRTTGEVAAVFNSSRESIRLLQTSLIAWFRIHEELTHV